MMWYSNMMGWGNNWSMMPSSLTGILGLLTPFAILDLVLKGFALWRAAKRSENVWFIILLVVNSLGILPAVYLLTHKDKPGKK